MVSKTGGVSKVASERDLQQKNLAGAGILTHGNCDSSSNRCSFSDSADHGVELMEHVTRRDEAATRAPQCYASPSTSHVDTSHAHGHAHPAAVGGAVYFTTRVLGAYPDPSDYNFDKN